MITINGAPQTTMDLIRQIIINQLELQEDHVNIYDEKWVIPSYDDLFVTIEYRSGTPIANNNYFDTTYSDGIPREVQVVLKLEKIIVGVFSRNNDAEIRKDEVSMAIMSQFSQLLQESAGFKIARVAPDEDLSALEGAAMLKRYDFELSVYAWYQKTLTAGYMIPPVPIQITADDAANNILQQTVSQLSQLPK